MKKNSERLKVIRLNALAYYEDNTSASLADAFVAGALWADNHPRSGYDYEQGIRDGYRQYLDAELSAVDAKIHSIKRMQKLADLVRATEELTKELIRI